MGSTITINTPFAFDALDAYWRKILFNQKTYWAGDGPCLHLWQKENLFKNRLIRKTGLAILDRNV